MKITEEIFNKISGYELIKNDLIDYNDKVVSMLSLDFIKIYKAISLKQISENNNLITICGIADPYQISTIDKLVAIFGENIKIVIISNERIQKINSIVNNDIKEITIEKEEIKSENESTEINNAPVVRIFESILREGTSRNASDIHIEPFEKRFRIRFRIDGVLITFMEMTIDIYDSLVARCKVLANLNITEKRCPQDGRIKRTINEIEYDFRVSIIPTVYGEKIVIRILDSKSFTFDITNLGFSLEKQKEISEILKKRTGIILITGPTGCGKSTTLYSFLKELSSDELNIITVEDPVEYTFPGVSQVQVNSKIGLTFSSILRSTLRQDPDVIMIGEIRDEETASIAIRLAITGHLVLSTLHTSDSVGAILRLINLEVEPFILGNCLNAVISQRLVRRLCNECKTEHITNEEEMELLNINEPVKIYNKKGCSICHNTGYIGRIGVYEILNVNEDIKEILYKNGDFNKIKTKAYKSNKLGLRDDCKKLVLQGLTTIEELIKLQSKE